MSADASLSAGSTRRRTPWERLGLDIDPWWFAACILAAGFFGAAAVLPLWHMRLVAPQYPAGLEITAYGTRMIGDLYEVNTLNHYIGAMVIEPDSISELVLFPYALGAMIGAILFASVVRCPISLRVLLSLAVWSFPALLLVDLQWWLWRFGHELNEEAPMRALVSEGFTPKVLGHTHIINFDTVTGVEIGFWMMVAGALAPGVPWAIRFLLDSWRNTAAAAVVLAMLATAALSPQHASAAGESLAARIAAAPAGATIEVPAGTYHEQLTIDRPLTLVGIGAPVLDGGGRGDVVRITAEGVTLRGFVIRGSARDVADEPAGIRLIANRATIEDNQLRDVLYGISLVDSSGHQIRRNAISSVAEFNSERRGHAVYLWNSDDNRIEDNRIDEVKDGIFVGYAHHNEIRGNTVTRSRYGIHYMSSEDNRFIGNTFIDNVTGGAIMFSKRITLEDNRFSGNRSAASGFGLLLKDVDDLRMVGNRLDHNRLGVTIEGVPLAPGTEALLRDNVIAFNQVAMELATNTAATFTGNSFLGNLEQLRATGAGTPAKNRWDEAGRGNYWDDYRGYDAGGDGVGDIAFQYGSTYADLTQQNESLRAYTYTSARTALELALRWFPVFRSEPLAIDRAPLMSPVASTRTSSSGQSVRVGATLTLASMVGGALLVLTACSRRSTWHS
jgi:nitrous oxidase accessory protein